MTEDEGGADGNFLIGGGAGGEAETIGLGEEAMEEGEEENGEVHHNRYIGCLKHFFIEMFEKPG